MVNNSTCKNISSTIIKGIFLVGALLINNLLLAQENPPIPINVEVSTVQFLNFGVFTSSNSGGTISVDYDGIPRTTGDVVPLNLGTTPTYALFDVSANPGTIISITHGSDIELTGSNGGTIKLNIDSYSKGKSFLATAVPPMTNSIAIGGTLTIGNLSANPSGNYSGTFTLTFIQQ